MGKNKVWISVSLKYCIAQLSRINQALPVVNSYSYEHHFNDYDWFFKADDDTYAVMENMQYMLTNYSADQPIFFGGHFRRFIENGKSLPGGHFLLLDKRLTAKKSLVCKTSLEWRCRQTFLVKATACSNAFRILPPMNSQPQGPSSFSEPFTFDY